MPASEVGVNHASDTANAVTEDHFLGGRFVLAQPSKGYRAGVDAVILAAMVSTKDGPHILDAGSGVGAIGLCVAARCGETRVTLVEREPELVALARRNVALSGMANRVCVIEGDVTGPAAQLEALGVASGSFEQVLINPPFHDARRGTPAGNPLKANAHAMGAGQFELWARFAARALTSDGKIMVIHKADALAEVLDALANRFGNVAVKPVYAFAGEPAIRVIIRARKGSRAPLAILPGLVLHQNDRKFTVEVEGALRRGEPLPFDL